MFLYLPFHSVELLVELVILPLGGLVAVSEGLNWVMLVYFHLPGKVHNVHQMGCAVEAADVAAARDTAYVVAVAKAVFPSCLVLASFRALEASVTNHLTCRSSGVDVYHTLFDPCIL